jgi:cytochrome P450 family 6
MAFILFSFWSDFLLCLSFLFMVLYLWNRRAHSYWKRKGVPGPKPTFILGHMGGMITMKSSIGETFSDIYTETKHLPHAGAYMALRPTWVVNDLELIKRLLIGDFAHFTDHAFAFDFDHEPLAQNLFNMRGEKWKKLRIKLTPTFTLSRMKQMFETLERCAHTMMEYMESNHEETMDVKEILAKFSTDVIGSAAFGLECDSFKNPEAEFRMMGKKLLNPPTHRAILRSLIFFLPDLMNKFKLRILDSDVNDFFYNTVKNTVEYRQKNNIKRNDFIQLLIQLKNDGTVAEDNQGKYEFKF